MPPLYLPLRFPELTQCIQCGSHGMKGKEGTQLIAVCLSKSKSYVMQPSVIERDNPKQPLDTRGHAYFLEASFGRFTDRVITSVDGLFLNTPKTMQYPMQVALKQPSCFQRLSYHPQSEHFTHHCSNCVTNAFCLRVAE